LVTAVEQLGFAGLFCDDHFVMPAPPEQDSLELIVALTYLADHSQRIRFGSLVAPLSFRDPVMLARQASALDNLSSGRMVLGVGVGYMEREHTMFGYGLGDMPTRLNRFEEGLHVISRLLRSNEPVTYAGHFYRLQEAFLLPRAHQPESPKLLIGAKGLRRTLPLVARYADIWNPDLLTLEDYQKYSTQLAALSDSAGRQPDAIKRTVSLVVLCGRDATELERRVSPFRILIPALANQPLEVVLARIHAIFPTTVAGSPDAVVSKIRAYAEVGVEELIIKWFGLDDIEGLEVLAEHVLPHFTTQNTAQKK
jgi:alkanesulfonate monooxygenase SsuD/methylene tetrahydromethanopterin reductase-like flavin-dependent oxidoreductase (luciferase family)